MRVRMRQSIAGTFHGRDQGVQRGEVVEVGDVDGERYIANGLAEPVDGVEESAVLAAPGAETATTKRRPSPRAKKPADWHDDKAPGWKEVETP